MTSAPVDVPRSMPRASRRGVLVGAAAVGAAATLPALPSLAEASAALVLPPVRPYIATPVPDVTTRHMANRFAYGYTPELGRDIKASGGARAWFQAQLDPASIPDTKADAFESWFPSRHHTPQENYQLGKAGGYAGEAQADQARFALLRRTYSKRQVHEVMTEFWQNHLHVNGNADKQWFYRTDWDRLMRKHALGRFDAMLQEAIVHPTMLTYLDADLSILNRSPKVPVEMLNENLGRELLELHTVGRTGGYSEAQVTDSARILTGNHVQRFTTWAYSYQPDEHVTGPVRVMGFSNLNAQRDGRPVLKDYLQYLATHPKTAERIARKLAVRFVSDTPSDALVAHLAAVFIAENTDIKATLQALVDHPEFAQSVGMKVRTPSEDLIQTLRVYGIQILKPTAPKDAANAIYYISRTAGQIPFGWGPPDGFPDSGPAWSSSSRMMGSYHVHYSLAGGWYPSTGVRYRTHASWLPQPRIRFDALVDHLCRVLLGRKSTSLLVGAACLATEQQPGNVITADTHLVKFGMPKLLGILLDTPQHLTR